MYVLNFVPFLFQSYRHNMSYNSRYSFLHYGGRRNVYPLQVINPLSPGLVLTWTSVRAGRVLCAVRRARLLPPPVLPLRPAGRGGERPADRGPHAHALLLRVLRQPRPRQQVDKPSL